MPNAPSRTDKLSASAVPNELSAYWSAEYMSALNKGRFDGSSSDEPSSNDALLDWMSTEGLLEHVTCEANCD